MEVLALGGDVRVGAARGVEVGCEVGAVSRVEIGLDDGILVRGSCEVVGEAAAGEGNCGFGLDAYCGADGGDKGAAAGEYWCEARGVGAREDARAAGATVAG